MNMSIFVSFQSFVYRRTDAKMGGVCARERVRAPTKATFAFVSRLARLVLLVLLSIYTECYCMIFLVYKRVIVRWPSAFCSRRAASASQ